jgi:hypothetical protein
MGVLLSDHEILQVSRLKGSQDELKKKVQELELELSRDKMKNAESKYKQEFVKLMVSTFFYAQIILNPEFNYKRISALRKNLLYIKDQINLL